MAKKGRKPPKKTAPPSPRRPEDIRQEWANTAATLGDQERIKKLSERNFAAAQARSGELHTKLDALDEEFKLATAFYAQAQAAPKEPNA